MRTSSESFEEIALPHLNAVYRAAVAICGHQREADDLVQDTFLKAFERFELFEKGTNCKAWLLQILRNTWIDQLRHRKIVGRIMPLDEEIVAEKLGFMKVRAVKVWTKTGILSGQGSKNLVFRQKLKRNCLRREKP